MGNGKWRLTSTAVGTCTAAYNGTRPLEIVFGTLRVVANPSNCNIQLYLRSTVTTAHNTPQLGTRVSCGLSTSTAEVIWIGMVATAIGQYIEFDSLSIKSVDTTKCCAFDDTSATVPLISALQGKGLGLLLDRSKSSSWVTGLCPDGLFNSAGAWILANGATVSGGSLSLPNLSTSNAQYAIPTEVGRVYRVIGSTGITGNTYCGAWSGLGQIGVLNDISGTVSSTNRSGYFSFTFVAVGSTSYVVFSATGATTPTLDNVSVDALPVGNHRIQSTVAARGEISRRYNILTATQAAFNSGNWARSNIAVTDSFGVAPDGTNTASLLQATTTDGQSRCDQSPTVGAAKIRFSAYVKAGTASFASLKLLDTTNKYVCFNLATKAVTSLVSGFTNPSVVDLGNGWLLISAEYTSVAASNFAIVVSNGNDWFTASIGDNILVWGADLRLAADAIPAMPPYQRVTTASEYDEAGFPAYWRAQTDDGGSATIDVTAGSTKALFVLAMQKMTDATVSIVLAFKDNSLEGWVRLQATPNAGLARYGASLRGNPAGAAGFLGTMPYTTYPAPHRSGITWLFNVAGVTAPEQMQCTINGIVPATSNDGASVAATGVFSTGLLRLGYEGLGTNFANMREFAPPLIIFMQPADPGLSASQLRQLQQKYANYAGVSL